MASKLCVCGRSQKYPVCDNSHSGENWTCLPTSASAVYGFCASRQYENVALKLAAHYQGVICTPGATIATVDTLVVIIDSADLSVPLAMFHQTQARIKIVVCFGRGGPLLRPLFPGGQVHGLGEKSPLHAFGRVRSLIDEGGQKIEGAPPPTRSLFLSHAVRDEPVLMSAVDGLTKHYGADVFTCADSIPTGQRWRAEIMGALRRQEVFVMALSASFAASTFSAFEIGYALALEKPMVAISLDGTLPPAFIQHLQMIDIPRLQNRRPWLDPEDILLDELLSAALGPASPSSNK